MWRANYFITNSKGACFVGRPVASQVHRHNCAQYLPTVVGFLRSQSVFLLFLPPVLVFLSVGVILPLTLSLFSSSSPRTLPVLGFIWTVPVPFRELASAPNSRSVSPSPPVLPALSPLRLPLSISPHLRCGNWEMLIWPGAHRPLPGPPTYLPLFSTAEAGNLLLACSVVLKCVTGAKWVPVLVNAEKKSSTDNERDLVRKDRWQHDELCFRLPPN